MPRVIVILVVAGAALYSFFDVLSTDKSRFRTIAKSAWLLVTLVPVIGAVLWFTVGRGQRDAAAQGRTITLPSSRRRQVAPDDDPAFLRRLDEEAWRARRKAQEAKQPTPPKAGEPPAVDAASAGVTPPTSATDPPPVTGESDPGVGMKSAEEQVDPEIVEDEGQQPD